jgi:hypothetical protein
MAQFTLQWDNTSVLANANATAQRTSYRQKSLGGVFNGNGFTPANDLAKSAITAESPVLLDNVIYEFKVQAICTQNGPTDNDNGIQEGLVYICLVPTISKTHDTATLNLDLTNTDILKVRLTLKKSSDNSIINGPVTIDRNVNGISYLISSGLTPSTNYYWQIELGTTVGGVEIWSSDISQLGSLCGPYPLQTDPNPVCNPVTSVVVTSIEIL